LLAPVLLEYGTPEQCRRFLPPTARGEIRWCQGYSEPDAGSDLASLKLTAERRGDTFVLNGQKVWTSHANLADWMFCLVRSDTAAPKRDGISFILLDMASPGISVKPIQLISGASPFCETFFDDVHVPAENLVGALHGGWAIAKKLLGFERQLISTMRAKNAEEDETLAGIAEQYAPHEGGRMADPILRDAIAQVEMDLISSQLTVKHAREAMRTGQAPGPEISMFKLYGTELNKRRKELRVMASGYQGIGWQGDGYTPQELQRTRDWLRSRASSIEGGTSEIQLNIIAKRVLGLPTG
jgi:alkylation response protein AidB-like acyl-CoA dehydrogenase